jgi:hypothetical protein
MPSTSRLAEVLSAVFTHSGLGVPARGWAKYFDVPMSTITQYKNGAAVPSPGNFRFLRDFLITALGPADPVRQDFLNLLTLPLEEVGLDSSRMARFPTLSHYLNLPVEEAFAYIMQMLNAEDREEVLEAATRAAWVRLEEADLSAEEPRSNS